MRISEAIKGFQTDIHRNELTVGWPWLLLVKIKYN